MKLYAMYVNIKMEIKTKELIILKETEKQFMVNDKDIHRTTIRKEEVNTVICSDLLPVVVGESLEKCKEIMLNHYQRIIERNQKAITDSINKIQEIKEVK